MTAIRVIGGRLFSDAGIGFIARSDQLGLLNLDDMLGLAISGLTAAGEVASATMTADGQLRVTTEQTGDWLVGQRGDWNVTVTAGTFEIDQSGPGYTNAVAIIGGQGGVAGGAGDTTDNTLRVVLADDTAISVTGGLTDTELRASAVPVSVASLPLPADAATATNQAAEIAALASIQATIDDGVPVTGTFWQATQPVSIAGTVTVSGGLTDTQLRATAVPVDGSGVTQPVSLASVPSHAVTNAGTFAVQASIAAAQTLANVTTVGTITNVVHVDDNASTLSIDDGGASITVDGSVSVSGSVTATGPLTDTELRASAVPISASSLPLPTSASTDALQSTGNTALASILTALTGLLITQSTAAVSQLGPLVQGVVNDSPGAFDPSTVQPLQLTSEGRLRVSAVDAAIDNVWRGGNPFDHSNPYAMESPYV